MSQVSGRMSKTMPKKITLSLTSYKCRYYHLSLTGYVGVVAATLSFWLLLSVRVGRAHRQLFYFVEAS
jgi:hypothetical protein